MCNEEIGEGKFCELAAGRVVHISSSGHPISRALEVEQGCAFREILLLRRSYVDWGGMRGSDAWSLERRASATAYSTSTAFPGASTQG